jgi:hypothetical protein
MSPSILLACASIALSAVQHAELPGTPAGAPAGAPVGTSGRAAANAATSRPSAALAAPKPPAESPAALRKSRGVSVRAGASSDGDAGEDGVRSALRVERFVICDGPDLLAGGDGAFDGDGETACAHALGAVEWRRMVRQDGVQIECEMLFARAGHDAPCERILHVEELCEAKSRLVWREIGDASGRSVLAEWGQGGQSLRTVDWGKVETVREEISASRGAVMPLYLIEMLREGRITSGRQLVFDPLARALSELEILTSYIDASPAPCPAGDPAPWASRGLARARCVELRRSDGTLAGRYRFRGSDLVAFQWQDGGAWARRASAHEHARAVAELSRTNVKDP